MDLNSELNLSEIMKILWKRRFIFSLLFFIIVFTVLITSVLIPPAYRATTKIIIQNENDSYPQGIMPKTSEDKVFLSAQKEIISSRFIINKALENVQSKGLLKNADYEDLHEKIFADYKNDSNILELKVEIANKNEAIELVNTIADTFVDYNLNAKAEMVNKYLDILTKQTGFLKNNMEAIETRLKEFNDKDFIGFYQAQIPYYVDSVIDLSKKNTLTEADIERLQAELVKTDNALSSKNSEVFYPLTPGLTEQNINENPTTSISANPLIQDIKIKLNDMQTNLSSLLTQYTEEYPDTAILRNRIGQLQKTLEHETKKVLTTYADYYKGSIAFLEHKKKANESRIEQYKSELDNVSKNIGKTAFRKIEFDALLKNYETIQTIYSLFLQKENELKLLSSQFSNLGPSNIRILERSSLPLKKARPNIPLNLALGALFGIFIGSLGAAVSEKNITREEKITPPSFPKPDKRRMSRVEAPLKAMYEIKGDSSHIKRELTIKDISATGAGIKINETIPKSTQVSLKILIGNKDSVDISAAEVIWITPYKYRDMFEAGLHFINVAPSEREKLINYLYYEHYLVKLSEK